MTPSETISLTRWIFVGKVMSLIFNMLSRLVISFLPRSKHLLISWLQSPTAVTLEPPKIKFLTLWWHYCWHPPRELIPYPGLLNPEPQPLWQATADLYLHRSHSNTQGQVWLSLCGFSWWAKPFVWALWASLAGMGFDSKHNFAPPTILFGLLLCPWRWGILFLVGSNILLLMVVQQWVVVFEFLQQKMSACPLTLPSCLFVFLISLFTKKNLKTKRELLTSINSNINHITIFAL